MKLQRGFHLTYSTNIHRGEDWRQTFDGLNLYTLRVREQVCPDAEYGIGLRLSERAARELADPRTLLEFQRWLESNRCYVFTINGFPYGQFHGQRVKEQVYLPDWTDARRVDYTLLLFEILSRLVPDGVEGSVSTVPGSYKDFITSENQRSTMRRNLWTCVEKIAAMAARTGKKLHLGLEPEPLCYLETSSETVEFFQQMRADRPGDVRLDECLGVNYDTCHLAVEFETPEEAMDRFHREQIKVSKIHFSSALRVKPGGKVYEALEAFADDIYFHQVVSRMKDGGLRRYKDLDAALALAKEKREEPGEEWRIHFHVPLQSHPSVLFSDTSDHILGVMDILGKDPALCSHLEMETYTWEVLPPELKKENVVDQLVEEYRWCLARLSERGIHPRG